MVASGWPPATSASATCCRPSRTTTGSSPATPAASPLDEDAVRRGRRRHRPGRASGSSASAGPGCCRRSAATTPSTAGTPASTARRAPIAEAAPAQCSTCGFLVPLGGSLRRVFGVCANAFSPERRPGRLRRPRLRRPLRGRRAARPGRGDAAGRSTRTRYDLIALHPVAHPPGSVDDDAPTRGPRPLLTGTGGAEPIRPTRSAPQRCAPGCSTPGPPRPPGSARTPTPRTTWCAAAIATGWSSSSPRTPPTPLRRAGEPGRLLLRLTDTRARRVATPAPRSTRPASSRSRPCAPPPSGTRRRRSGTVGRFGVGFAAVLAVTDEPRLASTTGARALVGDRRRGTPSAPIPALAEELARRSGQVPVLRLPLPDVGRPAGRVRHHGHAAAARRRQPPRWSGGCSPRSTTPCCSRCRTSREIEIVSRRRDPGGGRRGDAGTSYAAPGLLDPDLLRDRPVEERDRPWWSLTWARPRRRAAGAADGARADADRRAARPAGPADRVVPAGPRTPPRRARAADRLPRRPGRRGLRRARPPQTDDPLAWCPARRGRARSTARCAPLPWAPSPPCRCCERRRGSACTPRDAVVVRGRRRRSYARCWPTCCRAWSPTTRRWAGSVYGACRWPRSSTCSPTLDREPEWWHGLYAALADRGASGLLESLGALPVPLADGRIDPRPARAAAARRTAGCPTGLEPLGLRVVHADAAHPLLLRLGAVEATAAARARAARGARRSRERLGPRVAGLARRSGARTRAEGGHPARVSCPGSASCRCPMTTASSPPLASSCCPAHCSIASPTRRRSAARPRSCSSAGGPTCCPPGCAGGPLGAARRGRPARPRC